MFNLLFKKCPEISVSKLRDDLNSGQDMRLIDVRTEQEITHGKLEASEWVLMDEVPKACVTWDKEQPMAIMCKAGGRSEAVTKYLLDQGFTNVVNVTGGMLAWAKDIDPNQPVY